MSQVRFPQVNMGYSRREKAQKVLRYMERTYGNTGAFRNYSLEEGFFVIEETKVLVPGQKPETRVIPGKFSERLEAQRRVNELKRIPGNTAKYKITEGYQVTADVLNIDGYLREEAEKDTDDISR